MPTTRFLAALACAVTVAAPARAQDLEPRAYSASPVGANFLVVGVSRSSGAIVFDPALPISDVDAQVNGVVTGIGHTFNLLGKLALASAAAPYVTADLTGLLREERSSTSRSGLADSRLRLSVNLRGNDAMAPRDFARAPQRTVVGVSLTATLPASQYSAAKLINPGTNRWGLKPELGIAVPAGRWDFDAYVGSWFYFRNDDFYPGGNTRRQDPLVAIQGHASYSVRRGLWIAADGTWYRGGSVRVGGGAPSTALNNARAGLTASVPFLKRYSVKVAYGSGVVARTGTSFRTIAVAWQAVWLSPRWSGT